MQLPRGRSHRKALLSQPLDCLDQGGALCQRRPLCGCRNSHSSAYRCPAPGHPDLPQPRCPSSSCSHRCRGRAALTLQAQDSSQRA